MASLRGTCSKLLTLRDDAHALIQKCTQDSSSDHSALAHDLNGFYAAVDQLSHLVLSPQYAARTSIEPITARINNVCYDAQAGLELLTEFLDQTKSPRSSSRQKFKHFGYELYEHERKFQRLSAQIKGLEGWVDSLSQSLNDGSMPSQQGLSPGAKKVSFDSSASGSGYHPPPSPLQPTVEDDIDEDDPTFSPNSSQDQLDPPLFPRRESHDSLHGGPDMDPPRVVIRSPTDPATLEARMHTLNFDDDDAIQAPRQSGREDDTSPIQGETGMAEEPFLGASTTSLTNSGSRPRSRSQIEAELRRLTEEIAQLRDYNDDSEGSSRSRHSPSHSLDSTPRPNNFMRSPQPQSRARANTATSAGPSSTFRSEDYLPMLRPKSTLPAHVSPRFSPMTPSSPMSPGEGSRGERSARAARQRDPVYGADIYGGVLPTVLETGAKPSARVGARDKRASWAAEDFKQFFNQSYEAPDPPLFPQNAVPTRPAATRTTSNKDELPPGVSQKKLPVTLEDICMGANKKVRFKRRVLDRMGVRTVEDTKILTVQVFPGLKPGSRIKHPEEGDYNVATGRLGEVWFQLIQQDHARFELRNRDLHTTIEITLVDALCGWSRVVRSICGRDVKVKHPGVTKNGWKEYFAGLGIPKYDRDNRESGGPRGDMVVEVKVVMPSRLEDWQRDMIRRALGSGSSR